MPVINGHKLAFENFLQLALFSVLGLSFIIAYFPVMEGLAKVWWSSENYSHGFFVPPLFFYIIWVKREKLFHSVYIRSYGPGLILVGASLLAYIFAHFAEIKTLASLSMLACLMGTVLYLFGPQIVRELIFPFFLLFFMVPVPAQIYAKLTIPLQLIVTKISAMAADLTGIPVYRTGNILETPGLSLEVVEACSGMRSIITLLLLSALFAFFTLRSFCGRIVLFLSGIPLAILINIFRVVGIFLAWHFFAFDFTHGWPHKLFGLALFGIALAGLFLLQKGIQFWEEKRFSKLRC